MKKQENFIVDGVLLAVGDEKVDVFLNSDSKVHAETAARMSGIMNCLDCPKNEK